MRLFSPRRVILTSCCFVTAIQSSPAHGEGPRSTVVFRTPEAVQASAETPSSTIAEQPRSATSQPIVQQPRPLAPRATPRLGANQAVFVQPHSDPQVTNQTRQALGFYGGQSARATLSQLPLRTPIQPAAPRPKRRQLKPFQNVDRDPTISPYLNLYRDEEDAEGVPNYFTYVRPQMEQLEANRMQQREIQQLRGQVQGMSSSVAGPQYQSSRMPGTGTQARFMDTAQFYAGRR